MRPIDFLLTAMLLLFVSFMKETIEDDEIQEEEAERALKELE